METNTNNSIVHNNKPIIIFIALLVIGLGVFSSLKAAGLFTSFEPESGTLATGAIIGSDASASGGSYIQFNAPTPTPSPTPTPPPTGICGEPGNAVCDATNTGIAGKGLTAANLTAGTAGNTTANGQIILRKTINGDVCIIHNNVIIRESQINGQIKIGRRCTGGDVAVTGALVEDTNINPNGDLEGINDITSTNSIFQRNNICCTQNYITVWTGNNTKILNSFMHDESSNSSGQHFDGIEAYCWGSTLTIRGNVIKQTNGNGATAPLNITPLGSSCGTSQLLVEYNILQSANSAYVVLGDDGQGGAIGNAVFNNNRLWRANQTNAGHWFFRNQVGSNANYSGTGNTDYISGATVAVP